MKLLKPGLYTFFVLLFIGVFFGSMLLSGCKDKTAVFEPTGDTIADGKVLTQKYCTKCHEAVEPAMLTKDIWKFHALPSMSHYLGLSTYSAINYYKKPTDTGGVSLDEWQIIRTYYEKLAPTTLPVA